MSCPGDSGGPVFRARDGVEQLVGVTSYGDSECRIGINTRVPVFRAFVDEVMAEAAALPPGPRAALDPAVDTCEKSCTNDRDCPREMRCTKRNDGARRCAFSGLAPAALRESCNAVDGCRKERCVSLAAAGIASGECRCLHECDATEPHAPAAIDAGGGGCNVARRGSGPLFLLVVSSALAAFRRRRRVLS